MKKTLFLLIVVLALFSCKKEVPVDYAIVSVSIKNPGTKEISIYSNDRSFSKVVKLDEEGNFTDTIKVRAKKFTMYDDKNATNLYLEAGYNLKITYDAADHKNTVQYSGNGIETNNYFVQKSKLDQKLSGERLDIYKLDETGFNTKNNEIKTALTDLVASTEGLEEEFVTKEKKSINYAYLYKLSSYERTISM